MQAFGVKMCIEKFNPARIRTETRSDMGKQCRNTRTISIQLLKLILINLPTNRRTEHIQK